MATHDSLSKAYPLRKLQRELMLQIGTLNHYIHHTEMSEQVRKLAAQLVRKGLVVRQPDGYYRFTDAGYRRWKGMKKDG